MNMQILECLAKGLLQTCIVTGYRCNKRFMRNKHKQKRSRFMLTPKFPSRHSIRQPWMFHMCDQGSRMQGTAWVACLTWDWEGNQEANKPHHTLLHGKRLAQAGTKQHQVPTWIKKFIKGFQQRELKREFCILRSKIYVWSILESALYVKKAF